jgi:hypothetical protein
MTDAGSSAQPDGRTVTEHELEQWQRANHTGRQPAVLVHGGCCLAAGIAGSKLLEVIG